MDNTSILLVDRQKHLTAPQNLAYFNPTLAKSNVRLRPLKLWSQDDRDNAVFLCSLYAQQRLWRGLDSTHILASPELGSNLNWNYSVSPPFKRLDPFVVRLLNSGVIMKAPTAPQVRPVSYQARTHRYILFVNSERLGSYLLLGDLIADLKAESGNIKIQKIHVPSDTHSFIRFVKRGES